MNKLIVSVFALCLSTSAFAARTFDELVQHAVAHGTITDTQVGSYYTLQDLQPNDRSVAHQAEYFSVVGQELSGTFKPHHLEVVSENWRIDANGNWDVEQWGFVVSLSGVVTRFIHNHLVEQRDGIVLIYDRIPTTSAESESAWQKLLQMWENKDAAPALP